MNFIKKNIKLFIGILIGLIIASSIAVYATYSYFADGVGYTRQGSNVENVEQALNELYGIASKSKTKSNIIGASYRDITLYNGCEVRQDEENDYYLYFDGVNDYAQIGVLPATINWSDGINIEFVAKWDAFNLYSRIFDFGNGADLKNIIVSNVSTTNSLFFSFRENGEYNYTASTSLDSKAKYRITLEKISTNNYTLSFYKNNILISTETVNYSISNVQRLYNYLGKSNFSNDGYFKGRIYSLKIDQANGTNIIDIDVNAMYK